MTVYGSPLRDHRLADDAGVAAKLRGPQPMAQDDDVLLARLILVGGEGSSQKRLHGEDVEIAGRHSSRAEQHRLALPCQRQRSPGRRHHRLEGLRLALPIQKVQRGNHVVAAAGRLFPNLNDSFRVGVWQRLEHRGVDEAEDGAVGADAQCQRHDRDG